jgi:hypothetical protein
VAGCDEFQGSQPTGQAKPAPQPSKIATPVKRAPTKATTPKRKGGQETVEDLQQELDMIAKAYDASRSKFHALGTSEEAAVKKIATAIKASLELGPTLVVWIIDRTQRFEDYGRGDCGGKQLRCSDLRAATAAASRRKALLTAVVGFDEQTHFAVDPLATDAQQVKAGFDVSGVECQS